MKRKLLLFCLFFAVILVSALGIRRVKADGEEYDYVDNNTSDVDGVADKGTHSNFTAEKNSDGIFDTLTEEYRNFQTWVSPTNASSDYMAWFDHANIYDENTSTRAYANTVTGAWSGPLYATLTNSITCNRLQFFVGRNETFVDLCEISIYNSSSSTWHAVFNATPTWNTWQNTSIFTLTTTTQMKLRFHGSGGSDQVFIYEVDFLQYANQYELDLEVQWTNANYTRTDEQLCIKTGTTGAEDLLVYAWNGSWQLLFNDLEPASWNNISISSFLTSGTFTIRLLDATQISDSNQDTWQIDASLLHTWESRPPTISEFQAESIVYANKYTFINATIDDPDNNFAAEINQFVNASIQINGTITLLWVNSINTFSEYEDPSGYCTLDVSNSVRTQLNNTAFKLSWRIKLAWNYSEGAIFTIGSNTKVFDNVGYSGTGATSQLFTFENDLIVASASVDDDNVNPSQNLTFTSRLYYQGTSTPPEDVTGITGKVSLEAMEKGSSTSINATGYFMISFNAEASVTQYNYEVYAVTDQNTEQNQTVPVIVNKAKIVSGGLTSTSVHVGENTTLYYVVQYEYDLSNIVDGAVLVNGTTMTYNATSNRWEYIFTQASLGTYGYLITSISGNTYGITTINDVAGMQNCTFYANINLRTVDSEGNIFSGATVYMSNGTSGIPEPVPGYSTGSAIVGITYYSIEATSGWANWTGITNGTLTVYATWKGLTVNATFSFTITADTNKDVKCLCYPFTHESQVYYAASNATITSVQYLNYVVTVTFSSSTGNYLLCADSPQPTYLLNVTYNLAVDYTTYLSLAHSGDRNIVMGLQNWGGTYVQKTDKIMTALTVEGQKLTLTFTGTASAVGEVDVKCGMRGNPAETGGFTTSSYVDNVFIGYYVFNATEKTVYLQWSVTGPGPIGAIQYPEYPNVYIEIAFSFPKIVQPGQKVQGNLTVTWSGVNTIKLETLKCEAPCENWTIQVSTLPIALSLNATLTKGFVQIPVTLTIPARAIGTYNVPCITSFTAAPNLVRGFRSALNFQVVVPTTPVPSLLVYAFLGSIAVFIPITALFTSRRRKHRLKPYKP